MFMGLSSFLMSVSSPSPKSAVIGSFSSGSGSLGAWGFTGLGCAGSCFKGTFTAGAGSEGTGSVAGSGAVLMRLRRGAGSSISMSSPPLFLFHRPDSQLLNLLEKKNSQSTMRSNMTIAVM